MQHFLSIADSSSDELWQFLYRAKALKDELKQGHNQPVLRGKTLGMVFQKPSSRTVDGTQSLIFEQAENRLHAQKGVLALLLSGGSGSSESKAR
jgi:ornithine carbamoyltransferase